MLSLLQTLSRRQVQRHRTRTAFLVLSVALGVAGWVASSTLDAALHAAVADAAEPLAEGTDLHVSNGDVGVPPGLAARIAGVRGIHSVRSLILRRVVLSRHPGKTAVLVGVDLASERAAIGALGLKIRETSPTAFVSAALRNESPVLVGARLNESLGRDGAALEVSAGGTIRRLRRVGVIDASGAGAGASLGGYALVTDLRTAAGLNGRSDLVSRIDIQLEPAVDRAAVRARLDAIVGTLGQVSVPGSDGLRIVDALGGLRAAFRLCGAAALVLSLVVMAGTQAVNAAERAGEVGLLRALGAERGQVRMLFLIEALLAGAAGAGLGLPIGWGLAWLSWGPMLRIFSDVVLPLQAQGAPIDVGTSVAGAAAGVLTAVLAALLPACRAADLVPVEALSETSVAMRPRNGTARILTVTSWGIAAGLFAWGDALAPRLGMLGGPAFALLGILAALPVASGFAARLLRPVAERLLGPPGRLAADHLARTPGTGGLAVAALTAGAALIVQTAGVIHGNEAGIGAWLDHCIAGDLFVTAGGPLSASGQIVPMADAVGARIEADLPGAQVVPMRFRSVRWKRGAHEERVLLVALDANRYYNVHRERRPALSDLPLYGRLAGPATALVSENFAALHRVREGDSIRLPGTSGSIDLTVVGTVADYSCSRGTIFVDRNQHRAALSAADVDVFSVSLPPNASPVDTARRLQQTDWAAERGLVVLTRDTLSTHILGMVGRLYGVAHVQEAIAMLVAALGVASALLVAVLQRRREIALLRALGATAGQAAGIIAAEALLMAVIGALFGLALGAGLEWYVLRVMLPSETGFTFPVRIPWVSAAGTCGLAIAAALAASFVPALSAAKGPIADALGCE